MQRVGMSIPVDTNCSYRVLALTNEAQVHVAAKLPRGHLFVRRW